MNTQLLDPPIKSPIDKAALVAYVLGNAYLENLKLLTHELKHSDKKEHRHLAKVKEKIQLRLHNDHHKMFFNAKKFLTKTEAEALKESVSIMIDALW